MSKTVLTIIGTLLAVAAVFFLLNFHYTGQMDTLQKQVEKALKDAEARNKVIEQLSGQLAQLEVSKKEIEAKLKESESQIAQLKDRLKQKDKEISEMTNADLLAELKQKVGESEVVFQPASLFPFSFTRKGAEKVAFSFAEAQGWKDIATDKDKQIGLYQEQVKVLGEEVSISKKGMAEAISKADSMEDSLRSLSVQVEQLRTRQLKSYLVGGAVGAGLVLIFSLVK